MGPQLSVLLVHHSELPWKNLSQVLKAMGLTPCQAKSCDEARYLMDALEPEVVFSEPELPDGNWQSVLQLAEQAALPINVIVVGKHDDMELYLSAMQQGAHDYIAPPIAANDLSHILRCAMDDAHRRRMDPVS